MGLYLFQHPKTGEVKEIIQKMNDTHVYIENGENWVRLFLSSNFAVDSQIKNPFSEKEFVQKTGKKVMSQQDYWDVSKEQSTKRTQKSGADPVLSSYYSKWSQRRKNKVKHPDIRHTEIKENLNKAGVIIED